MYWSAGSGRIALKITLTPTKACTHPGQCDDEVRELSKVPAIARQLRKLDPYLLASELREYGAWDDEELADPEQNLQRLLWIACGDIVEEHFMKRGRK